MFIWDRDLYFNFLLIVITLFCTQPEVSLVPADSSQQSLLMLLRIHCGLLSFHLAQLLRQTTPPLPFVQIVMKK